MLSLSDGTEQEHRPREASDPGQLPVTALDNGLSVGTGLMTPALPFTQGYGQAPWKWVSPAVELL